MNKLTRFLEDWRDRGVFSGAAFAVGTSHGVLEQGTVGTLAWDGEPVTPDALWDLASVTKPIAVLPLIFMLEQGELCLDDTIAHFLTDYKGTDKADITLFQLLTHTGGIPGQQPLYQSCGTREQLMTAVRNLPLRHKPGTYVEYTSQGFMILGDIVEKVAGQSLEAVLQGTLFEPLGMSDTLFNPRLQAKTYPIAATEYCAWRKETVCGEVHDENAVVLGGVAGHAGLFSTIGDMSLLCQAMLRHHGAVQGPLMQGSTAKLMTGHHTAGLNLARALGWQAKDRNDSPAGDLFSPSSYGHTGFTGTSVWMDPEADLFVALLTNRVHPTRANPAIKRVRAMFHNLAYLACAKRGQG
ncbi:serine hydrolase domain-containing protein [Paenibacillus thalictri]|uniref:Class A beta-lactamase-related serine hydrolase n=1 Tax=Paenibacillus thalictri TaxID=2527873 RepID=A0A4Q9DR05_9BACL|nr:serine hydrolase domain-containing protein [Paenibacillus thalictri]TBL76009.1 class A beta-lactamase-related serine hydrolase [Paenibacillus thalictri]